MFNSNSDQKLSWKKKKTCVILSHYTRRLNEYVGKWIGIIEKIKVLCNPIRTSSIP